MDALTSSDHWDDVWLASSLPSEVVKGRRAYVDAITDVFDTHLASGTAIELGGAVGAWAAYLIRNRAYDLTILDYAPAGVSLTRRNLDLLGLQADVVLGDMFAADLGQFDLVYSLGVIEHFDDTCGAVAAHLRFAKPGGMIMVGCPNYRGANKAFARYVAPAKLAEHNLNAMRIDQWPAMFERKLGLTPIFRGYVGGFEPLMHKVPEGRRLDKRAVAVAMKLTGGAFNLRVARPLRRLNHPLWSNYCLGIYRVSGL